MNIICVINILVLRTLIGLQKYQFQYCQIGIGNQYPDTTLAYKNINLAINISWLKKRFSFLPASSLSSKGLAFTLFLFLLLLGYMSYIGIGVIQGGGHPP
jgi:hypothetical protein